MKIRIKFAKGGSMKYIGHLDTMRYFQKAMRRADIDIAYTSGFSPHQVMSFAAPLGVGITSGGEYLDIEVHETKTTERALRDLNAAMVDGFAVLDYRRLPDGAKPAMSIVTCADYTMTAREGYGMALPGDAGEAVRAFYEEPERIEAVRQAKKSEVTVDLKRLVYAFEPVSAGGKAAFYLRVSAGSTDNVKPEFVMEHFFRFLGLEWDPLAFSIHRHDVYTGSPETGFISLNDCGETVR